jgi:hypothetical protein
MKPAIELHLRVQIADGRRDDFLHFIKESTPFYEQPGGIRVRLLEGLGVDGAAIEVIEYATDDDYRRDQQRAETDPQMRTHLKRWRELLANPPHIEVFRCVKP